MLGTLAWIVASIACLFRASEVINQQVVRSSEVNSLDWAGALLTIPVAIANGFVPNPLATVLWVVTFILAMCHIGSKERMANGT